MPESGVRMEMTKHLRAVVAAGLAVLVVTAIAATRSPAEIAGQPGLDRGRAAETTFPYPHLLVMRLAGDGLPDEARLILDDGSVAATTQLVYQVPADNRPFQVATSDPDQGTPVCDDTEQICWGQTTVAPTLATTIQLTYVGIPCTITGSPGEPTTVDCTDPGEPVGHP